VYHLATYHTRNSLSTEAVEAAEWLVDQLLALGCDDIELHEFRSGYAPNVLCYVRSTNPDLVVVGAHYDSRARSVNSRTERAPGADDNGTGSAGILELFRVAQQFTFEHSTLFAFFAGEEQGLYGSDALAAEITDQTYAMINCDMIGWEAPGEQDIVFF